ncbi:hypothetical protein CL618_00095 [archaeon]|nr:hypothetical protein [archaeon]
MKKYSISAFFPAYGDEKTIGKMVLDMREVLEKISDDYEIIVVDDGGPDRSGEIADELSKKYKEVKVIHHEKNRGYGGALKSGFYNSSKELVFYTDGDAQYDVKEINKLLPYIEDYDVVNGYKIKRHDPFYRIVLGRIYHHFVKLLFNLKIKDVDCDFRLIKRKVFDVIKLEEDGGIICVELVKKLNKNKFRIKEVPVHHYARDGGSQFFKLSRILRVFRDVVKLRFKLWFK